MLKTFVLHAWLNTECFQIRLLLIPKNNPPPQFVYGQFIRVVKYPTYAWMEQLIGRFKPLLPNIRLVWEGCYDTQHNNIQHNDTQNKGINMWHSPYVTLSINDSAWQHSVIMLSVAFYSLLCYISICWVSFCWVSLCWMSWRPEKTWQGRVGNLILLQN